jgi:hypothetical protein
MKGETLCFLFLARPIYLEDIYASFVFTRDSRDKAVLQNLTQVVAGLRLFAPRLTSQPGTTARLLNHFYIVCFEPRGMRPIVIYKYLPIHPSIDSPHPSSQPRHIARGIP